MMKNSLSIMLLFGSFQFFSQETIGTIYQPPQKIPCGGDYNSVSDVRKPVQYAYLRASDVAWEKRVWREIDLREKENQKLYYPVTPNPCHPSLFQVLSKNILNGNLIAFTDENFLVPMDLARFKKRMVKTDTVPQTVYTATGEETEIQIPRVDSTSIYEHVLKYCVKEDWFFNRQTSSLDVRTIGIAAYEYDYEKELYRELFWVYFPACRPYLAAHDVFNVKNDRERRSMDDIFWKRQFSSAIVKESNVYDRYISEYSNGIDALVESEKIKMDIFTWEHDLWQY